MVLQGADIFRLTTLWAIKKYTSIYRLCSREPRSASVIPTVSIYITTKRKPNSATLHHLPVPSHK